MLSSVAPITKKSPVTPLSWYKVFLANDAAYKTYLNGDELKKQRDGGRVFAQPQDYFYQE